ncbi:MAG: type II secretion system F family protein [bacterium]|nr:type II secretion system F family protein [bacterium]
MQSSTRHYNAFGSLARRVRLIGKDFCAQWIERNSRLSIREQLFFVQRLAFILKANIPLADGLKMMRMQAASPTQIQTLDTLLVDILNGNSLHVSLSKVRPAFGAFAINIIRVGETGGILSQNLTHLHEELKKKYSLQRKLWGALLYPALIVCATLSVASLLTLYLFPRILPVIKSLGIQFPLSTRILISIYEFWAAAHWWLAGTLFLCILGSMYALQKEEVRAWRDMVLIRTPLLGNLLQHYYVGTFCRTLGLLLCSNVKVDSALEIASQSIGNRAYRDTLILIRKNVIRGETISVNLERFPRLFPSLVPQLTSIGEATGDLSHALLSLADMYESEMDDMARAFAQSLEPTLMIILGLIIGFVAIAIITPFYAITQQLHP